MTPATWFAVGCVLCGGIGLLLGWAACSSLMRPRWRAAEVLDEEFFRRFRDPEPVTSVRTLVEAEDFQWVDV